MWKYIAVTFTACWLPNAAAENCVVNGTHTVHCTECQTCNPGTGCELEPGFCLIRDAFCHRDGEIMRNHGGSSFCMVCNVSESTTMWVRPRQPAWCSDGIFCNGEDWCELDETTGQYSSCTGHSGDPCANNEFCNNTCTETAKSCSRPDRVNCDEDADKDETDICKPDLCMNGECAPTTPDPPPSCTLCGCEGTNDVCNKTTGLCGPVPTPGTGVHGDSKNFPKYYWAGVGGGATVVVFAIVILLVRSEVKRRREAKYRRTVYYRVTEDEGTRSINKGL